jgi:hypothetical protein
MKELNEVQIYQIAYPSSHRELKVQLWFKPGLVAAEDIQSDAILWQEEAPSIATNTTLSPPMT